MQDVIHKETELFAKTSADILGSILQGFDSPIRYDDPHDLVVLDLPTFRLRISALRNFMAAVAVSNGP